MKLDGRPRLHPLVRATDEDPLVLITMSWNPGIPNSPRLDHLLTEVGSILNTSI